MTNDTDYRGQLRAVFLAAIMVVSIFGAGMAFTGAASAQAITTLPDQTIDSDGEITVQGIDTPSGNDDYVVLVAEDSGEDGYDGTGDPIVGASNTLDGGQNGIDVEINVASGNADNTDASLDDDEIDAASAGPHNAYLVRDTNLGQSGGDSGLDNSIAGGNGDVLSTAGASTVAAATVDVPNQDPTGTNTNTDLGVNTVEYLDGAGSDYNIEITDQDGNTATLSDQSGTETTSLDISGTSIAPLETGDELTVELADSDSGNTLFPVVSGDTEQVTIDSNVITPPTVDDAGNAQDVEIGASSTTQTIENIDVFGVDDSGSTTHHVAVELSSLESAGVDTTDLNPIEAAVQIDNPDVSVTSSSTGGTGTSNAEISYEITADSGVSSYTIQEFTFGGLDTQGTTTVSGLSHDVEVLGSGTTGGDVTSGVTTNTYSLVSSAGGTEPDATYNFQGSVVYQGQDAYVYGDDIKAGGSYSLRTVDAFDAGTVDSSSVVEELKVVPSGDVSSEFTSGAINQFNLDTNGDIIALDTADYEAGDYFVAGTDSSGDSLPSDGQLARSGTLEIAVQETSLSFAEEDQPSLNDDIDDSTVELDYSSGRDGFSTNVSANGDLDDEDLFNILAYSELVDTSQSDNLVSDGQLNSLIPDEPSLASEITEIRDDGTIVSGSSETDSAYEFFAAVDDDFREAHSVSIDDNADYDLNDVAEGYSFGSYNVQFYQPDEDDADEKVLLNSAGVIDEEDVRTIGIDENDYDVIFNALDTEAESTAQLSVQEQNLDASFEEGVTQDAAGDITSFNLTLEDNDEAWVQIGGESSDFVDVLYLEADDASEPLSVDINTRLLGTAASIDAVYDEGDNVDTIQSEMHGGIDASNNPSGPSLYGDDGAVGSFEAYLDAMEIIDTGGPGEDRTDQLIRPLQSTDYEIRVGSPDADVQVFDADDGGEAEDELASKTLELQQPEIGEITTHTAPEDDADATTDVSELVDAATPREEVAADDRLIVQVEATGIFGALVAGPDGSADTTTADDPDFDRLTEGASSQVLYDVTELRSEQVTFEVTADSSTGNQDALEVDLESASDSETFVVLDEANEQFFLVVDTSSDNSFANGDAPDEATDFTVNMEYDADNEDDRYEFSDSGGDDKDPFSFKSGTHQNYPYLQQGDTLSNSVAVTVAPRSVDYDNINENDVVQAENTAESVISGETNVAPGSEVSLRVQSTDASSSFRQGNDINITEDGSFETQFDLSGQEVGDEFDTNFRVEGSSTDSTNSVIVEEGTLSTAEPADEEEDTNETDTDGGEDADDGEEPADDGEEPADDGSADDGSTDDGTPGFGAVVALIALIGAALLAVRRQN